MNIEGGESLAAVRAVDNASALLESLLVFLLAVWGGEVPHGFDELVMVGVVNLVGRYGGHARRNDPGIHLTT